MSWRALLLGTVRRQLVAGVVSVQVLLMGLFVTDLVMSQHRFAQEQQTAAALNLARSLAWAVGPALRARDTRGLAAALQQQAVDGDVVRAMVMDSAGRILAHTDGGHAARWIDDLSLLREKAADAAAVLDRQDHAIEVAAPLVSDHVPLGWVRLTVRLPSGAATARPVLLKGVGFVLGAVLFAALVALSMGHWLTTRLTAIRDTARRVQAGDTAARVEVQGNDETSEVARSLNRMLDSLSEKQATLEQTQAALQASRERLDLALTGSSDGIWDWDLRTNTVHYSLRWKRMLGHDEADIGTSVDEWQSRVHPDDLAHSLDGLRAHLRGDTPNYRDEYRLRHRDGHWIWVLARGLAVRGADGHVSRFTGTHADITEQRQASATIQTLTDRLQLATDTSGIGIWDIQLQSGAVSWNDNMYRLHDLTPQELAADTKSWLERLHPQDRAVNAAQFVAALQGRIDDFSVEFRILCRDGTLRWIRSCAHAHRSPAGQPDRLVGTSMDITATKLAEAELRQKEGYQRALLNNFPFAVWLKDPDSRYLAVNSAFYERFGLPGAQGLLGHGDDVLFDADTVRAIRLQDQQVMRSGQALSIEEQWPVATQARWYETFKAPVVDAQGALLGVLGFTRDITEQRHTQASLRLAASVFDTSQEAILISDAQHRILNVNQAFVRISGYERDEVLGRSPSVWAGDSDNAATREQIAPALQRQGHWSGELWGRRKSGARYPLQVSVSEVHADGGEVTHHVVMMSDISRLKAHEQELLNIAHYDPLTSLPNRRLLADRLHQALAHAQRHRNAIALVVLDLDGFKPINDTLGHEAGDQLLREIAQRLERHLRGDDTAARLGGDEFVLVLLDMDRENPRAQCELTLQRLLDTLSQPVQLDQAMVSVSASLGATIYPLDDADADTLLRHADQAMYVAKQQGKNRYHFYDAERDRAVQAHREALARLQQALQTSEFVLYYQPKVNMRTGALLGAEALIRWQHPEQGLLAPGSFLHVLDHTDLELQVGQWVIETALQQVQDWHAIGLQVPVSVNVSARQLMQADFAQALAAALARHTLQGGLELELLESAAVEDRETVIAVMQSCRALGVRFALDDFGTGYSSLVHLRRMPVETLKIDQTFVRDMLHDADDLAIVESVVRLCSTFHRDVVAEGVETERHAAALLALGCLHGQGYGIARPMPARDLPQWLAQWQAQGFWRRGSMDEAHAPHASAPGL